MKGRGDPARLRRASDSPPELAKALQLWRSELPAPEELERIATCIESELSADGSEVSRIRTPRVAAPLRPVAAGATLAFKLLLAAAVAAVGAGVVYRHVQSASVTAPTARSTVADPTAERASPIVQTPKRASPGAVDALPTVTVAETARSAEPEAKKPSATHAGDKEQAGAAVNALRSPESTGGATTGAAAFPDASNAAEAALVERAQRAVAADPAGALRIAGEHATRFPGGILAQEREFVAIQALLGLGRRTDAEARAAQFRARFPDSVHRRRLDLLLGAAQDGPR